MKYLVVCKSRDDAEIAFNFTKRLAASGIGLGCNNLRLIIYTRTADEYHFLSKSAYLRKFEGTKAYEIISLHDFENEILVKWRERNGRKYAICKS